jgi:predicted acylesterase/phospholipase RssA
MRWPAEFDDDEAKRSTNSIYYQHDLDHWMRREIEPTYREIRRIEREEAQQETIRIVFVVLVAGVTATILHSIRRKSPQVSWPSKSSRSLCDVSPRVSAAHAGLSTPKCTTGRSSEAAVQDNSPATANSNCRKRGLVLEGGGAKGAYAFGCLRALEDHGVEIDAISGTSVGAVNAMLAASGHLKQGAPFWENLSRRYVFGRRSALSAAIALVYIPLSAFIQIGPMRMESRGIVDLFSRSGRAAGVMGSMLFGVPILMGLIFIPMLIASFLMLGLYRVLQEINVSILTSAPLREALGDVLGSAKPKIPTYVTLARRTTLYDPDFNQLHGGSVVGREVDLPFYVAAHSIDSEALRINAIAASTAIPFGLLPEVEYDLSTVGANIEGCDGSVRCVDGGIADNTPLLPLVTVEQCDEIIVIRLGKRKHRTDSELNHEYMRSWKRLHRRLALKHLEPVVREMVIKDSNRTEGRRTPLREKKVDTYSDLIVPCCSTDGWPSRIIEISPAESIGGLLRGTLNFNPEKARGLISTGYRDALAAIRDFGLGS